MRTAKWIALTFFVVVVLDLVSDFGKWALGRYTAVPLPVSFLLIVVSSVILACVVEVIHRVRSRQERQYEQYFHHKAKVWVAVDQKGGHWHSSLCPDCMHFSPDNLGNCLIESVVHTTGRDNHLVLVIWECPKFRAKIKR